MDTITHVLTGAVMALPAKKRYGKAGAAALIIGSFAPDVDLFDRVLGSEFYFRHHRVFTNSLPGMFAVSLAVAALVWLLWGRRGFKAIFALSLVAVAMHLFMDLTNSYGMPFFWPVSHKWYALDAVFIVDPWLTGLLILSLVLMKLRPESRNTLLAACFTLLAAYWGMRIGMHAVAVNRFKAENPAAVKLGAFPRPVNPFAWQMVAEKDDRFETGLHNFLTGSWQNRAAYAKAPETEAVAAARAAPGARAFLEFARFPYVTYTEEGDGTTVRFQDIRFAFRSGGRGFVYKVRVGKDGSVKEEEFNF